MFSYVINSLISMTFKTAKCQDNNRIGRDNGFGNQYVWAASLESGFQIAKNHQKPMMLIIHKSWCKSCKKFKGKFAESNQIHGLSHHFVMVNVMDEDEPDGRKYAPDGDYIPRFVDFGNKLNKRGNFATKINKSGSSHFAQFFSAEKMLSWIYEILFLSHLGDVFNEVYNEHGSKEFRYYYSRPDQVAHAMYKVINMLGIPQQ